MRDAVHVLSVPKGARCTLTNEPGAKVYTRGAWDHSARRYELRDPDAHAWQWETSQWVRHGTMVYPLD